jgi:YVTN family beta-propeller protein
MTKPGAAIVFDGTHIWVANVTGNSVTKLDMAGNVIATYNVGVSPIGIAFDGPMSGSPTREPTLSATAWRRMHR